MEIIKDWIIKLLNFALVGFDESVADAATILSTGIDFNAASSLSNTIAPFANTILVIACLIELCIGAAKMERLRWEDGVKIGVKLCLGKVCIELGSSILQASYLQAQSWINAFGTPDNSVLGEKVNKSINLLMTKVTGFGGAMGLLATALIMVLAIIVCGLLIKVMAYARIFELYAYIVVSPLPLAFAPLSGGGDVGLNNITKRFLKSYAGVCLQGVMMLVVLKIFNTIIATTLVTKVNEMFPSLTSGTVDVPKSLSELLYTMLLGSIALVVAVSKSGSWAKSIMDGA